MGKILKPVSKISGIHGQPGEERVAQELASHLPDDYCILNSPRIHYKGETIDIDHIIIGPNGIFAIESKNMLGKIYGGLMGNWIQEKRRAGKKIKIKIGNPATQVNQYGKVIQSYLTASVVKGQHAKINFQIYPVVVFAFDNIDISRIDYTEPGMVGRVKILLLKELCQYILSAKEVNYTEEEINFIADTLIPADQRDQTGIFSSVQINQTKEKFSERYEIYEEIGRGNFAIVYRGFDFKLDREVAVKKLYSHKNDKETIKRFFREAQINSKLQHDNIVSIYDFYEEDGECYLIMEFVEGETLLDFIRSEELTNVQLLEIMEKICSAVQHAHSLNVIHRDLKPANILINLEGKVKVTDFGIARLAEEPMLTQSSTSIGTPTIMAPEQATGKETDSRSDIFSLGVLMYFLFTREYPFLGEHIGEVIHKIMYFDPVPPTSINEDIPIIVEKIILKALEKEPEDRFQSVEEMRQAILFAIDPELAQDVSVGLMLEGESSLSLNKSIPKIFRSFFANEKRKFMAITLVTILIFGSLIFSQSYLDSKNKNNNVQNTTGVNSQIFGFNNENIGLLYQNPGQYQKAPVNLVGKVEHIESYTDNTVLFTLSVQPSKDTNNTILVKATGDASTYQNLPFVRVFGYVLVQNLVTSQNTSIPTPIIIANQVDLVDEPWTIMDPANYILVLNQSVNHNNKIVTLKRIEFTDSETRLFIGISNQSNNSVTLNLDQPRAKQGGKELREIPSKYGKYSSPVLKLDPNEQVFEEVVFLEPLKLNANKATITLGTKDQYTFDVSWH